MLVDRIETVVGVLNVALAVIGMTSARAFVI